MSTYKFTYFDIRGLGETSRYIFAVAEQEYEDIRITLDEWSAFKEKTPLGQLPFLEVDGEIIPQSMAIHRYLGRKFGLYGETDIEKARIDVVLDVIVELNQQATKATYEPDEETKKRFQKDFNEVQIPTYLAKFEKLLTDNQGGDGYFVGSKISIADIAIFDWTNDKFSDLKVDIKEPKLKAHAERMKALPQIDAWLKKRPQPKV